MTPQQFENWTRYSMAKALLATVKATGADRAGVSYSQLAEARQIVSRGFDRSNIRCWRVERSRLPFVRR